MNPFSLLVKPASADCNLRCEYCFYLDRCLLYPTAKQHRMSPEVLECMVRSFMETEQAHYGFSWQGGEPTLMTSDFFTQVTSLQERYCPPGARVSNGLQTNATLIDDVLTEHLADYNFLVGVSLDGPATLHNRYRRYLSGKGSHADVIKGIDCLKRHKVEFNTLTLVTQANVKRPAQIYRYLRDEVGSFFHQYIECVEFDDSGNLMPFAIKGKEWSDFLCGIYDEWRKRDIGRVSVRLFDSILTMMVDGIANVCAIGRDCRHYFVVEYNGDVYPCDFFVEKDLKLGNVMESSWESMLASPVYKAFGSRKAQWHADCEACPYLGYCAGCCPKNRPDKGWRPKTKSVLCEGWKNFFAHALPGLQQVAQEIISPRMSVSEPSATFRKVGRNQPCPCGSGRKFKKCCGA